KETVGSRIGSQVPTSVEPDVLLTTLQPRALSGRYVGETASARGFSPPSDWTASVLDASVDPTNPPHMIFSSLAHAARARMVRDDTFVVPEAYLYAPAVADDLVVALHS